MAVGFCTCCNYQVESFDDLTKCPQCGTTGVPCSYEDQRTISINLHELRLLCIWAENWQSQLPDPHKTDVVYSIATRIRKQLKDCPALTMADEFQKIKDLFPSFETNHPAADNPETGENYYEPS